MSSSFVTRSRRFVLLCVCVCTWQSLFHTSRSHLTFTQVFSVVSVDSHFHAFPTSKTDPFESTRCVCVSVEVDLSSYHHLPPGSLHSFFNLFFFHLPEQFLPVIYSIFTLCASQSLLPLRLTLLLSLSASLCACIQVVSIAYQ